MNSPGHRLPSADVLAAWIAGRRWFAGKARRITAVDMEDEVPVGAARLLVVVTTLDDGTRQRYAVPVGERETDARADAVVDALDQPDYARALLELVRDGRRARGIQGEIAGQPTRAFPRDLRRGPTVRRVVGEQSNTSVVLDDRLILKHFRRLVAGRNPDEEIGRFLTERTTFRNVPPLAGHLEYRADGTASALAVVHEFAPGAENGWGWMLGELREVYRRAASTMNPEPERVRDVAATTLAALRRLGAVTADMHAALASDSVDPAFAPEPITPADVSAWAGAVESRLEEARRVLDRRADPGVDLRSGLAGLIGRAKIRHHGDFHLGQTLHRRADPEWLVIDFEGEPLRPLEERRAKHAALRDVAGMLRSLDYAAVSGMPPGLDAWARAWEREASAAFVDGYGTGAAGTSLVPGSGSAFERAVAVFVVEKAAYEVVYEASHRPAWLAIPLGGLERARAALTRGESGAA